nr:FAD-dependent oxidoreductase [Bacillus licheniformis]
MKKFLKFQTKSFRSRFSAAEPHPNYNRILLSKVLQGDTDVKDITLNDWDWYEENGIQLYTGEEVVKVDPESKTVITDTGRVQPYDELILATGSLPFILPLPGADKEGVTAFRDIKDTDIMLEASKTYKKATVIGDGSLGLEAARGLLNLGMDVTVVHLAPYLMERQLDAYRRTAFAKRAGKAGHEIFTGKADRRNLRRNTCRRLKIQRRLNA